MKNVLIFYCPIIVPNEWHGVICRLNDERGEGCEPEYMVHWLKESATHNGTYTTDFARALEEFQDRVGKLYERAKAVQARDEEDEYDNEPEYDDEYEHRRAMVRHLSCNPDGLTGSEAADIMAGD